MADQISMDRVAQALGQLHIQILIIQQENDELKEKIKQLTDEKIGP